MVPMHIAQVREMEGIPLLLDCTRLDMRNPLMTQWAVVALRNLCRENQENQAMLASIDGEGVAINTLEDEFGIKVARKKKEEQT